MADPRSYGVGDGEESIQLFLCCPKAESKWVDLIELVQISWENPIVLGHSRDKGGILARGERVGAEDFLGLKEPGGQKTC